MTVNRINFPINSTPTARRSPPKPAAAPAAAPAAVDAPAATTTAVADAGGAAKPAVDTRA
ncbi:hypothetical protein [Andreprevotia chitinilytica]|uniref:hypothetical protein n=1 Tax=Andreprevotia chitinilytica TaxID=396808 RepID=UPI0005573785|nr:hypothetical protein [Andreprevotia chitinilytica]